MEHLDARLTGSEVPGVAGADEAVVEGEDDGRCGLGIGIGATLGVVGARPPAVVPADPAAAALVTRAGETVGSAGTVTIDGRRMLVLTVTNGRPGMTYECILIAPDGSRTSGGTWTLDGGYEGERASGTWMVPLTDAAVASVELTAPSGKVWSTARF